MPRQNLWLPEIVKRSENGLYQKESEYDLTLAETAKRLVSSYQSASVQTSSIDGQFAMEDRQLLTMSESDILSDGKIILSELWVRKRKSEENYGSNNCEERIETRKP